MESSISPEKAPVRPHVVSDDSDESLPLDEVVLELFERSRGLIHLDGPPGSGKTTALRHLAAVLPANLRVVLLDTPDGARARTFAEKRVVYCTDDPVDSAGVEHLATLHLAPWTRDDCIEYLLTVHHDRCASVMARLENAADLEILEGNPELWTIVLSRMAADDETVDFRDALLAHIRSLLTSKSAWNDTLACCRSLLGDQRSYWQQVMDFLRSRRPDDEVLRVVRHEAVRLVFAADVIASELASGGRCSLLAQRLPVPLILEVAASVRDDERALETLEGIAESTYSISAVAGSMAASILHATGRGWRPRVKCVYLNAAHLPGAVWPGVNLDNATLDLANLTGADLRGASLNSASLRYATLDRADLTGAEMEQLAGSRIHLRDAKLRTVNASSAIFGHADLRGVDFTSACLRGAFVSGESLDSAHGARFAGADFSAARISNLDLRDVELVGACFRGTSFDGCNLEYQELPGADFTEASFVRTLLTGTKMSGAKLHSARLRRAALADIDWEGADLRHADLRQATFHMGSTRGGLVFTPHASFGTRTGFYTDDYKDLTFQDPSRIRKANLRRANLVDAQIDDVDFYLVDLREAIYTREQETHFRRCGAILDDWCGPGEE